MPACLPSALRRPLSGAAKTALKSDTIRFSGLSSGYAAKTGLWPGCLHSCHGPNSCDHLPRRESYGLVTARLGLASATGNANAVVDFTRCMAKRDVTFLNGMASINRL